MKVPMNIQRCLEGVAADAERFARDHVGDRSHALAGPHYVDSTTPHAPRKTLTGSGAPSFCWACFEQLQRAPGKGLGLFFFNLVRGPDGEEHRVHGDCTQRAIDDGCKLVRAHGAAP